MSDLIEKLKELYRKATKKRKPGEVYKGEWSEWTMALSDAWPTILRHLEAAEELAKEVEGMDEVGNGTCFKGHVVNDMEDCEHCRTYEQLENLAQYWRDKRDLALTNYRNKIKGV